MATAPVPFPTSPSVFFPTTATYPPPPFPGGYYNSPFPFFSSSPPAIPYVATYPYPPPASAYMAATGLSPAPAYHPSTIPSATAPAFDSFPSGFSSASGYATTSVFPSPAQPSRYDPSTFPLQHHPINLPYPQVLAPPPEMTAPPASEPPIPNPLCSYPNLQQLKVGGGETVDDVTPRDDSSSQIGKNGSVLHSTTPDLTRGNVAGGETISDEKLVHKHTGTEIFPMSSTGPDHHFITHQAPNQSRFELLHAASLEANSRSSPFGASTAGSVAPQVFDEMPTPSFLHGAHDIAPEYENYGDGYPNQIQSSCVQPGSTDLSEQYLDEMPQHYGLQNLNRKHIFLADGTEHSYFTLPTDYPLEQAPQPMSPPAVEHVGVTTLPSLACMATGLCSQTNITAGYESLTVHDVKPPSAVHDDPNKLKEMHVSDVSEKEKSVCQTATGHFLLFFLWDPGDTKFHDLFTHAASATKLQCTDVYKSAMVQILVVQFGASRAPIFKSGTMPSDAFGLVCNEVNAPALSVLVAPCSTGTSGSLPSFENRAKLQWDPGIAISSYMFIWPEIRAAKTLTWLQSPLFNDLQYQLQMSKPFSVWDPGILSLRDMMLGTIAVPNPVHIGQTPCKIINFIGQPVDLKQLWAQLLSQYRSWDNTPNVCLQVQYYCLQMVLSCQYSILVCYSRKFSSTEAIHSAMSMSTASTMRMRLVLSSGKIAQEGGDAAAEYHVSTIQLPMSKPSYSWDPGIDSLMCVYIWLHVHMIQQVDCSATHACYFVPACSPLTQISTRASGNTELDELTSPCVGFHLQQSTKWTSTSPTGIASSEYAYTMDFIIDQWEFLHKQRVQKIYNVKNMLSSPNYLQILELDIIFITFLPP